MLIRWDDLDAAPANRRVTVAGFPVAMPGQTVARRFLLTAEPGCCPGCAPRDKAGTILVEAESPVPLTTGIVRLSGCWSPGDGYRLTGAKLTEPAGWSAITRRRALATGPLMCMAAGEARAASMPTGPTVDLHTHTGGIASVKRIREGGPFSPVAEPMRIGGMSAICLAIVSDGPTHRVGPDKLIHPYRDPNPGELYEYAVQAFERTHGMIKFEGLRVITGAAGLRTPGPGVIVTAEGGDFLEGKVERVDEAYQRWSLRQLQLTHYRVNELGDIQTEQPVHGGLTDTGAEVIRRCNKLGIVVDIAHGTYELVKRAVSVTTKPLVLSHTSLAVPPPRYSRRITPDHARLVAETGGVIGIWPVSAFFPDMDAYATGFARMADVVGVDHVGLGTDLRGLVGPSVLTDYDRLPDLAAALGKVGFGEADVGKILGGNYMRVFEACMG